MILLPLGLGLIERERLQVEDEEAGEDEDGRDEVQTVELQREERDMILL